MMSAATFGEIPRTAARLEAVTPEIEYREYPRIQPGTYSAYVTKASKPYRCRLYKRWTVALFFDVFAQPSDLHPLAKLVKFISLGTRERPHAGRAGQYFREWCRANGGPPARKDRLSPIVFARRRVTVSVDYTDPKLSAAPYSVVRSIVSWDSAPTKIAQATALAGVVGHSNQPQPGGFSARESAKGINSWREANV